MTAILTALVIIGLLAVLLLLVLGVVYATFDGDAVHWPEGLDEPSTTDVQNHIGDSRPILPVVHPIPGVGPSTDTRGLRARSRPMR